MSNFPFGYEPIEPSTWAWLSSLLMLALFFKFNRFWSFRNLDLILIILLSPGLLMVHYGHQAHLEMQREAIAKTTNPAEATPLEIKSAASAPELSVPSQETASNPSNDSGHLSSHQMMERSGYVWLFAMGIVWIIRLLYDSSLTRKPMLEPNLSRGGLVFLTCSLLVFLFANVLTSRPADLSGPQGAANIASRSATETGEQMQKFGPGYPMLHVIPSIPIFVDVDQNSTSNTVALVEVARIMAILSQIAIIAGLVIVGSRHFGSFPMGVGMATIFLMLPYTAQFAGDSMHLLPGALLIWAIACYRIPLLAGVLVGLAAGVCYYPFFLLPLWISFYWQRGRKRFALGAVISIVIVVSSLAFTSADFGGFLAQVRSIFGFIIPRHEGLAGIWALNWDSWFRLPLLVVFIVLCVSYAFWPSQKDLSTLISCSAAAMIAVQFWHGQGGGLFMAWYLPLILLVSFRPNLDDKVAIEVLQPPRKEVENSSPRDSAA